MARGTRPLDGKRILVTRPEGRQGPLLDGLRRLGADVIHIPAIRIAAPRSWAPVDRAIRELAGYDWVLFTSAQGVDTFFARLRRKRIPGRIGVVGPVTAEAVSRAGGRVSRIAAEHRAEALAPALGRVSGKRVLIPSAERATPELPRRLREAGAHVDVVPVYRTVKNIAAGVKLAATLRGGLDIAVFTSSSTAESLAEMLGKKGFKRLFRGTKAASIGPVTSATLRKLGVRPAFEARTYTAKGLLEALRGL